MSEINIPGPGSVMALAAAVSIYSAAKIEDICLTIIFLFMTLFFIGATYWIENEHIKKDIKLAELNNAKEIEIAKINKKD